MAQILIDKTTAQATSPTFSAIGRNNLSIVCNGLGTTESVTLQVYDKVNTAWVNTSFVINSTNSFLSIWNDTNTYRVVKTATTANLGVTISSETAFPHLDFA